MPTGVYKRTKYHREKIRKSMVGHKVSNETKIKIGLSNSIANKGKTPTIETRKKISEANSGKNHWNWMGGISTYARKLWHNRQRRNLKKQNGGSYTFEEWNTLLAQYNWTCPSCHRSEPEIKLTEDHIIPLKKGGTSNIENIQPLCKSCNSVKHTKTIKYKL